MGVEIRKRGRYHNSLVTFPFSLSSLESAVSGSVFLENLLFPSILKSSQVSKGN